MFLPNHTKDEFSCLGAVISQKNQPSLILLCDQTRLCPHLAVENQALEGLDQLLPQIIMTRGVEVIIARVIHILNQHLMMIRLPRIQTLRNMLYDGLRSGNMIRPLHNYHLEDDETSYVSILGE